MNWVQKPNCEMNGSEKNPMVVVDNEQNVELVARTGPGHFGLVTAGNLGAGDRHM